MAVTMHRNIKLKTLSGNKSRFCICAFCDRPGHSIDSCLLRTQYKSRDDALVGAKISRSRVKMLFSKTFAEIMFDCHLAVDEESFNKIKKEIDDYVDARFSFRGMVDYNKLSEAIFVDEYESRSFNIIDKGHIKALGYLVRKYIDAGDDRLKAFLVDVEREYEEWKGSLDFKDVLKTFGLIKVGSHYRKYVGRLT